jgi:ribose transport system substrate-binding protein
MQWLEPEARKEMESALARFGKIDLVYAHNDPAAHGAWLAAKAAGRENEMRFVGIDGLPHEGLQYVREGILDVCFEYPTGGGQAIDTALKLLAGESVPKTIVLPSSMTSSVGEKSKRLAPCFRPSPAWRPTRTSWESSPFSMPSATDK